MNIGSISIDRPVLATVISAVLVVFGTIRPITSFACDCGPASTVVTAVRSSHLVVRGTVIRADLKKQLDQSAAFLDSLGNAEQRRLFGPRYANEFTIVVTQGFKGAEVNDTLIIRTGLDPVTDCGLILSTGSDVIIYARSIFIDHKFLSMDDDMDSTYSTTSCSRTRAYSKREAKAVAKALLSSENIQYLDAY